MLTIVRGAIVIILAGFGVNRNPAARRAVGVVLRTLRESKGLSQEELGHLADLDRSFVGMLERGERMPTLESVWQLLHALGTSWAEFGRRLDQEPAFSQPPLTRRHVGSGAVRRRGKSGS